jgi:hypothetical protein
MRRRVASRDEVHRHNPLILGTENPHESFEHGMDCPEVYCLRQVWREKPYGPSSLCNPQRHRSSPLACCMHDKGCSCGYRRTFQTWFIKTVSHRTPVMKWRLTSTNVFVITETHVEVLCHGRSPDLTPTVFFVWGYMTSSVYVPPLPTTLHELNTRNQRGLYKSWSRNSL